MKKSKWLIFMAGVMLVFIGCLPMVNHYETAQTAGQGQFQIGGSMSPYYYWKSESSGSGSLFWPITRFDIKYGISNKLDIGAAFLFNFYIPGIALNAKYQFLKNNVDGAVLLDGSYSRYSYTLFGSSVTDKILTLRPAIVVSREKTGQFPFSLALGLHYWHVASTISGVQTGTSITSVTANLGLPIRLGSMRFMPEIGLWVPFMGSATVGHNNTEYFFKTGSVLIQVGAYLGYAGKKE